MNSGVVQKVTFLGNTDNVNFGWFAYDSTDGHPKKCYPILNHTNNPTIWLFALRVLKNPFQSQSTSLAKSASRERSPRARVMCPPCGQPLKRSTA